MHVSFCLCVYGFTASSRVFLRMIFSENRFPSPITPTTCFSGSCASTRQRRFHQLDPIRGPDRDHVVVEVIGRVVQPRAVAIADKNESPGPRIEHEGEI